MKICLLIILMPFLSVAGSVKGYTKKNGVYVQPYVRMKALPLVRPKK